MKQVRTAGIVLNRTDFGEADRIITFLTPDQGKIRLIAKAVRKSQSKLAGGIELFSVSDISYVLGRGDVSTLVSSRLVKHYGNIVKDLDRTNLAYEFIKNLNKNTEDHTEKEYFDLLEEAFKALDDLNINPELTKLWFDMQLVKLAGHEPNLVEDADGQKLKVGENYTFDYDSMSLRQKNSGELNTQHIKLLRLLFGNNKPSSLQKITEVNHLTKELVQPLHVMFRSQLNIQ